MVSYVTMWLPVKEIPRADEFHNELWWGERIEQVFVPGFLSALDASLESYVHKALIKDIQIECIHRIVCRWSKRKWGSPHFLLVGEMFWPCYSPRGGGVLPEKLGWGCAARFPKPLPYLWPKSAISYLWPDQKFDTLFMTWCSNQNPVSDSVILSSLVQTNVKLP